MLAAGQPRPPYWRTHARVGASDVNFAPRGGEVPRPPFAWVTAQDAADGVGGLTSTPRLVKPFEFDDLEQVVLQLLEKRTAA